MPQQAWSAKRERQYDHIKEGLEKRGEDEDTAEEIAARTVKRNGLAPARPKNRAEARSTTSRPADVAVCGHIAAQVAAPGISCTTRPRTKASRAAQR